MRFVFLLCLLTRVAFGAVPAELTAALKKFRTDAPKGWSYTQNTTAEGKSLEERFDATRPDFERWTILKKDGRAPTDDEQRDYREKLTRRSRGGNAPSFTDQFDLASLETIADTTERGTYRCRLKRGESGDTTADFLRVTLSLHKPSGTIESLEIASIGEFSPTFGVKIADMKTTMTFSFASDTTPSLPQKVTTRLRGRAFWIKSLDADMTVNYSDYVKAGKR